MQHINWNKINIITVVMTKIKTGNKEINIQKRFVFLLF